tara:strand:- start:513 stop:734 length:222 start_codon:yes stop_codon:yes gene_type:complete
MFSVIFDLESITGGPEEHQVFFKCEGLAESFIRDLQQLDNLLSINYHERMTSTSREDWAELLLPGQSLSDFIT